MKYLTNGKLAHLCSQFGFPLRASTDCSAQMFMDYNITPNVYIEEGGFIFEIDSLDGDIHPTGYWGDRLLSLPANDVDSYLAACKVVALANPTLNLIANPLLIRDFTLDPSEAMIIDTPVFVVPNASLGESLTHGMASRGRRDMNLVLNDVLYIEAKNREDSALYRGVEVAEDILSLLVDVGERRWSGTAYHDYLMSMRQVWVARNLLTLSPQNCLVACLAYSDGYSISVWHKDPYIYDCFKLVCAVSDNGRNKDSLVWVAECLYNSGAHGYTLNPAAKVDPIESDLYWVYKTILNNARWQYACWAAIPRDPVVGDAVDPIIAFNSRRVKCGAKP